MLAGRLRVTVGETTREIEQGDSFIVSSGIAHGSTAFTDGLLLDTLTPALCGHPLTGMKPSRRSAPK